MSTRKPRVRPIVVAYAPDVDPDWQGSDGRFFDAVVAALDTASIPARVREADGDVLIIGRGRSAATMRPTSRRTIGAPFTVGTLEYRCRRLHPDDTGERGEAFGWFTGDVDTWGKHTFQPADGVPFYFFADECLDWTPGGPL